MSVFWHKVEGLGKKRSYPLESGRYLCHFSDGQIETFDYDEFEDHTCGFWNGERKGCVTHWAILPDGPEEGL